MYERLKFLMEGSTEDLTSGSINSIFTSEVHEIINEIFGNGISKRDIIQCIGIKRTNACDLSSIDIEGGVAIYPTYSLINSNCYCNTRYFLCNPDILNMRYINLLTKFMLLSIIFLILKYFKV